MRAFGTSIDDRVLCWRRLAIAAASSMLVAVASLHGAEPIRTPSAVANGQQATDLPTPLPSVAEQGEKKPPEPYEIGSDKSLKDAWRDGFQAESAHKDFRVKIGGRTQI
ncbi:MAG: hypothetical protein ACKOBP_12745, partial [Planctomycetia bacterium]